MIRIQINDFQGLFIYSPRGNAPTLPLAGPQRPSACPLEPRHGTLHTCGRAQGVTGLSVTPQRQRYNRSQAELRRQLLLTGSVAPWVPTRLYAGREHRPARILPAA